jgi:phosphatidate phosphatase APP1
MLLMSLLVPLEAFADGAVMLFPAIGAPQQVTIHGRALKDEPTSGSSTLSKNLRRLMVSNWAGANVEVRFGGKSLAVVADGEGDFEASFGDEKGFPVGVFNAEAHVKGARPGVAQVEVIAPSARFFVVSDFDDTVAVSEVLSKRKLLANALLRDERTQAPVKGMAALYGCLGEKPAFALVSGSPVQFGPRVSAFLLNNGYPSMGLYLREISPATLHDYKQPVIRKLLEEIPNRAVLVGDSGEHDPEVYKQMRDEFPGRVLRIYIRDAGRAEDKSRFEGMFLFNDPKLAALDAVASGLATEDCVRKAFP